MADIDAERIAALCKSTKENKAALSEAREEIYNLRLELVKADKRAERAEAALARTKETIEKLAANNKIVRDSLAGLEGLER